MEKYLDLASPVEGFVVAESLRARSVQSSIASSMIRSDVSPELANLIRKEQDAEKQIAALNGLLLNAVSSKDNKVADELRGKIDKLRDERGELAASLEKQFPNYAEMVRPKPVNVTEIQTLLRSDEAMVSIYLGTEQSYIWAIPKSGPVSFAKVALSAKQVSDKVAALRSALDPNVTSVKALPAFDVDGAYRLYEAFLKQVEGGWKNAKHLTVVTNGALGYLPFGVLPTQPATLTKTKELFAEYRNVPWLAKTHTVAVTPSTSAFKALRTAKTGNQSRTFAGFGDPLFQEIEKQEAPLKPEAVVQVAESKPVSGDYPLLLRSVPSASNMLPALPDTREEILSIAKVLKADLSRDVFLGSDASLAKVKATQLSDYRVVEFATHGLTAGELGLSQPALALSGGDFLTVNDILQLKLNADWVVLSACNTAAAGESGTEAISGLGSAFFYSGAKSLLVTNWPVQSASAAKLTTELFRLQAEQPSVTRAEALQQAMLRMLDTGTESDAAGKPAFTYAHPLFWGPFSLVGDGG
ncbi:MAG: CHAT domain-containing protein [Nitrospiraceae bacterium]